MLAAGASERMGRPKALLSLGPLTLLGHAVELARACMCTPVIVVEGAHPLAGDPALDRPEVVRISNDEWRLGPLSSLQAGLRRGLALMPELDAVLVLPVERPRVTTATIHGLLGGLAAEPGTVWQPRVLDPEACRPGRADEGQPRSGHPLLWPRTAFEGLLALDPRHASARTLIRSPAWAERRRFLACDDPGVLDNLDTPAEYRALCALLGVTPDI